MKLVCNVVSVRYVNDTWVKIKVQDAQAFIDHINTMNSNIKVSREDCKVNKLMFLDCDVLIGTCGNLEIEIYRKPTERNQYLLFDSHHAFQHQLGVIRILHHRAENIPTSKDTEKKENEHLRTASKSYVYQHLAFVKSISGTNKRMAERAETQSQQKYPVIPYIAGVSEKLKWIFGYLCSSIPPTH